MTPERRKYLIKSSNKEREIRRLIRRCKQALSISKSECNAFNLKPADKKPLEYLEKYIQLKDSKILLQALRHELARLKGMDWVTVPKLLTFLFSDGKRFEGFVCSHCGETLVRDSCANCGCGRRILWNKTL